MSTKLSAQSKFALAVTSNGCIRIAHMNAHDRTLLINNVMQDYRTCMASSAENKSLCEVPKYVIKVQGLTAQS